MRTIKFRAWDKKYKHWVWYNEELSAIAPEIQELNRNKLRIEKDKNLKLPQWENLIVTQFTGLKDWHGQEIFEGDIVLFVEYTEWPTGWKYKNYFEVENLWDIRDFCWTKGDDYSDIKVIGNIFDQPVRKVKQ